MTVPILAAVIENKITEVHEGILIMTLQDLATNLTEDLKREDTVRHLDDTAYMKKLLKATMRVLKYYMIPTDLDAFKRSLKDDAPYTFDMSKYLHD